MLRMCFILAAYLDMLFCFCQKLEDQCVQDLMYTAVHASRSGPHAAFPALRKVCETWAIKLTLNADFTGLKITIRQNEWFRTCSLSLPLCAGIGLHPPADPAQWGLRNDPQTVQPFPMEIPQGAQTTPLTSISIVCFPMMSLT